MSAPDCAILSFRSATACSLPGTTEEENTIVSDGRKLISLWVPFAIRFKAANSSPCVPVASTRNSLGAKLFVSSVEMNVLSGALIRPASRATATLVRIEYPSKTILRPSSTANSIIFANRSIKEAKEPINNRPSCFSLIIFSKPSKTSCSGVWKPGFSTLVESAIRSSVSFSPISPKRSLSTSATSPSV